MEYSEKLLENILNPKHMGELEEANGIGQVGSPVCGDILKIYLKINDQEIIEEASFRTIGCGSAIASSSMATDMIIGKTIEEAAKLKNTDVVDALGGFPDIPEVKINCSVLAEEAIQAALHNYRNRSGRGCS